MKHPLVAGIVCSGLVALMLFACRGPVLSQEKFDPLGAKLPEKYLVPDGKFDLHIPAPGTRGKEASQLALDLLTRSRAKLYNLTGFHADMLQYTGCLDKTEFIEHKNKTLIQKGDFRFRLYPFSIRVDWVEGANKGRASVYVQRKEYKGKMFVYGIPILGRVSLDPNDKKVFDTSRRPITNAGLHGMAMRLLGQFTKVHEHGVWDGTHEGKKYGIQYEGIVNDPIEGRTKYKVIRVLPAENWPLTDDQGKPLVDEKGTPRTVQFENKIAVIYFDTEWLIPTRVEITDWQDRQVEIFSYTHLQWGAKFVKPKDEDFFKK